MKSGSMDQVQAAGAHEPGVSLGSILRWMPLFLLLALASGAFWTRQIWLPAFAQRNEAIRVDLGGLRISLRSPWVARNLADGRFALAAEYLEGKLLTRPRAVALVIRRYEKPNPEILSLIRQDSPTLGKISLKLGDVSYEQATLMTLAGEKGVKLVGRDKESVFLRLDFPLSRVALVFLTDRRDGVSFLDQMVEHTVSYSSAPGGGSDKSLRDQTR